MSFTFADETPKKAFTCHVCNAAYEGFDEIVLHRRLDTCPACETAPACKPESHAWEMSVEGGSAHFEAQDPCSWEAVSLMDGPSACREGGYDFVEYVILAPVPVTIKYDKGVPDWETSVYDDSCYEVTLRKEEA